jgi:hypothetical protein
MRFAIVFALAFGAVSFLAGPVVQPAFANGCGMDPNGDP